MMGLQYTLGKSSNRSPGNFNILAKLSNVQKIFLLEKKKIILEVSTQTIILIDHFSVSSARKRWVPLFCKITLSHIIHRTKTGKITKPLLFLAKGSFMKLQNLLFH